MSTVLIKGREFTCCLVREAVTCSKNNYLPTNPTLPSRILAKVMARTLWAHLGARPRAPVAVPCSCRLPGVSVPVGLPGWWPCWNVLAAPGRAQLLPLTFGVFFLIWKWTWLQIRDVGFFFSPWWAQWYRMWWSSSSIALLTKNIAFHELNWLSVAFLAISWLLWSLSLLLPQ